MGYYFHKTPNWLQRLYPTLTWKKKTSENVIYLTFDDGPIPEVTKFVLSQLKEYQANATFFCVGHNIEKYPEEFNQILENGHSVANHTFNHLVGWNTGDDRYLDNIQKCQDKIEKYAGKQQSKLFRPPHGRIKRQQIKKLKDEYEIVMWTYLTGDFDQGANAESCLSKAIRKTEEGDIVIFHDSIKAYKNLNYMLPRFLKYFSDKGFIFKSI